MTLGSRLDAVSARGLDHRSLRAALLAELRAAVPATWYVWMLTDPETCVGATPLADAPSLVDLPGLIRAKYVTATNRWTTLGQGTAVSLHDATDGELSRVAIGREFLVGYGVTDVVSTVLRDQYGCWGFLDLWRTGGVFLPAELAVVAEFAAAVTAPIRASLLTEFATNGPQPGDGEDDSGRSAEGEAGPAVLLLADDVRPMSQTPQADALLRALLPTERDRAPIPAAAFNVAGQLHAIDQGVDTHPASTRVPIGAGRWVTLRAARMSGSSATAIAVSIETTPPSARAALYAAVSGLTDREAQLLRMLVDGSDTRALAQRMSISEHTVQDHLKSIFAKTGASSRRTVMARATGIA